MSNLAKFRFPTDITIGSGAWDLIPDRLAEKGLTRPLIVADEHLLALPLFDQLLDGLKKKQLTSQVFSEPQGNPHEDHVRNGVESYRSHQADSLVIVGGGCILDVGKVVGLMASHPGSLFDYEDEIPDARPIVAEKLPFSIAVPTTAGTGSEVGASSVISDVKTKRKVIIYGQPLTPNQVVADPRLIVGLPPFPTAATGIDALTHNVEAYLAKNFHPMADGIALEGIRLVFNHLRGAFKEPDNLEHRQGMLMASMMGAVAFQKGLGAVHSCAHALSTCHDLHHGYANAIMFEAVLAETLKSIPEKFARLAHAIGIRGADQYAGGLFLERVTELKEDLEINQTLADVGVEVSEQLIQVANDDPCHQNNPVACTTESFRVFFANASPN